MPWHVTKTAKCPAGKPWGVIKDSDGSVEGCHSTKADAEKQLAALYANEPGAKSMTRTRQQPREHTGWYRISNQGDGPAQIMLYDLIGAWGVTAKDFLRDLAAIGDGPIEIHIASDGGDVFEAYAIYTALAGRPGVVTVVDSLAASSASVIAMAGEQRLMAKLSQMMIHDAWASVDGNADDLQHMIARLNTVSEQVAQVYADTAGGTAEHWRELMKAETWFTPAEALRSGLITGITGTGREPATAATAARVPVGAGIIAAANGTPSTDDLVAAVCGHFGLTPERAKALDPAELTRYAATIEAAHGSPQAADVDTSPWDGNAAMTRASNADDPAVAFRSICAGEHNAGQPSERQHWALPHHKNQGGPPNRGGVTNALQQLPKTQDLKNKQAAESHLEAHMKAINPDYQPGDKASSPGTQASAPAPPPRGGTPNGRETQVNGEQDVLTIEGRRSRIEEIRSRRSELHNMYPNGLFPGDLQNEWDRISGELEGHKAAISAVERRNAAIAADLAGDADDSDRPLQGPRFESTAQQPPPAGLRQAPAVHLREDIHDLGMIRNKASRLEDLGRLHREYARRVVDVARFPGSRRETAQENVTRLLDELPDDPHGMVARRIIATGDPRYKQALFRALAAGSPGALGSDDGRILALGLDDTGAYAIPFELDPTVILTSDGVVNPLRRIARVQQITGKEFDLVTSAGVVVTRGAERAVAPDSTPTLAQPSVKAEKIQGFIQFTVELEGDWNALQANMSELVRDAKDVEESSAFTNGTGVAPDAGGIIGTLPAGSNVTGSGTAGTGANTQDFAKLDNALGARWRARASMMAQRSVFNAYRVLFMAQPGQAAIPWATPGTQGPEQYPAYENSQMATYATTAGTKYVLVGDFRQYLIVDRVGMSIELVPQVFDTATGRPKGTRGYYVWWRNNAVNLNPNAFRLLVAP